jgi:hypothetical protein
MNLLSPGNGRLLRPDTAHSLSDGETRWPVIDGIAFLRTGRDPLAAAALAKLDDGDPDAALRLLLADQDDWWTGPTADPAALDTLIQDRDHLSLRDAMRLLGWGPVADYFAHRWSDPTFVAGLALTEAHWTAPATAFELACGIGHHLRALHQQGVAVTGADIVFAKLWVARHWLVPNATLLCFDAATPWPIGTATFDLVACHDAFYFLEPKTEIADRLIAATHGTLLVGHIHNRDWPNFSAGHAIKADDLPVLFPGTVYYDDRELQAAFIDRRVPRPAAPDALSAAEAFAVATGSASIIENGLAVPPAGARLQRNPLYDQAGELHWPSERYEREYAARATYRARTDCPPDAIADAVSEPWARRRELLDLPERW